MLAWPQRRPAGKQNLECDDVWPFAAVWKAAALSSEAAKKCEKVTQSDAGIREQPASQAERSQPANAPTTDMATTAISVNTIISAAQLPNSRPAKE